MKKIYKLLTAGIIISAGQHVNGQCTTPGSVTATPSVVCAGATTSLNATSAGSSIKWYTVPTCGVPTGTSPSGANFTIAPVVTTTFYAEAFTPAVAGGTMTLNYTGCMQQIFIPAGVTQVTIITRGAQGQKGANTGASQAGNGGAAAGVLTVTPGQVLNVFVGGQAGYNGGGVYWGNPGLICMGGGASDVRTPGFAIADRVIVGGGGGGVSGESAWGSAGHGGGGIAVGANFVGGQGGAGYNGQTAGNGGTNGGTGIGPGAHNGAGGGGGLLSGGGGGTNNAYALAIAGTGSLGLGGNGNAPNAGCCQSYGCAGGGGGYYGGGGVSGGCCGGGGAGGGSSWTGTLANPTFTGGIQTGNGIVTIIGVSGGCVSAARTPVTVSVVPSPTVSIAGGTAAICAGSAVTLTASGAVSYTWSNGAFTSTIAPTPTANITYSVLGSNGSCAGTAVKNITVAPVPTVAVSGSTLICGTGTNILTASGANTYSWSTGALTASVSVSPSVTTNYTVIGTNTLANCISSQTLSLVVSTNPTVAVTGSIVICNGQTTNLTASGANTYSWSNGAATATVALSPTATTAYTVVGTNTAGCAGANIQTVTVNPSPTVTVAGGQTICVGETATLTAGGANTYSWSNGATTSSIVISPTITTTYTAIGTTSLNGCTAINTAVITVDPCTGVSNQSLSFKGLSVYPNPGNGEFTIELKNGLTKTIEVTDYTGKVVFTSTSSKDIINVNLSSLANGIYNVKIQSNNTTEVLKVVKQ